MVVVQTQYIFQVGTLTEMLLVCCTSATLLHTLCIYAAHVLHIQYTCIACVLHTQKWAQHYMHATYMHMRSNTPDKMYARCVQLLHAAYMQLFMYSIHAACKQLHTNCMHFFICEWIREKRTYGAKKKNRVK